MRAMVIPGFGGPNTFELRDIPKPVPGCGEVLVRVIAAGTNPVDAKIRESGTWAGISFPAVLGSDVAGVVEAVGPCVTDWAPGDEVYYTTEIHGNNAGTYAEYNVSPTSIIARKPSNLSFEEAAAVPLAGGTAWEAIIRRLNLKAGETVLIQGGAGGVGAFAVQMARAAGARVLATAGPANQDLLKELGAAIAIDYRNEDPIEIALRETGGQGVDAVFDTVGGDIISRSLDAVRPFGRLACILTPSGSLTELYMKNLALHGIFLTRERARLDEMRRVIERGLVRPIIDEVLPLEEVAKAHERLDSGHGRGKIVLRVALS